MAEYDVLVVNGIVVSDVEAKPLDIAIKGEKVAAIGSPGSFKEASAGRTIDAEGAFITPGGVDVSQLHNLLSSS